MELLKNSEEAVRLLEGREYAALREMLSAENEADVADLLENLKEEDMLRTFRILSKDQAAEVFSHLDVDNQQYIINSLSDKDAASIVDNLMADDAADLMDEMPANVVKRILANASPQTRRTVNDLLCYPEDSAGSIMTVEYVDLKASLTVGQAIERIRKVGLDSETVNVCYVLDEGRRLIGTVGLRYLLLHGNEEVIGSFMNAHVISIHTTMDQEDVAEQFMRYDFSAMPVVDNENRLVGIVTADDVMDILEEEATEDIEKMNAILPGDKPYIRTGVLELWKNRIPWLLLLMISATFTGRIITSFENALSACVALTAFIPMLMDTGGNAGGQSSATIIRALSLNDIDFSDIFRVLWKEIRVAVLCGLTLSACNFVKLLYFDRVGMQVTVTVCLTLLAAVVIAKVVGCLLPMGAKRLGFDPAVMASPFITTIVDALSLLIYFRIASAVLGL